MVHKRDCLRRCAHYIEDEMNMLTTLLRATLVASCLLLVPSLSFAEGEVDINTATVAELQRLPGIGAVTAGRIVAHRDANGPFANLSAVGDVEGVSPATLEKIRPFLSFDGAAQPGVASAPSARGNVAADVKALLARYKGEPSIREVQEAAARNVDVNPERMRSWRSRSRLAALAPGIRAEYRYVGQFDQRLKAGGDAADTQQDTFGTQHRPLARVDWDLNRLVFNPDELRVSSEISSLVRLRESVLNQATKIYYERRRLQVELDLTPPTDVSNRVRKELRLQELVADLDSLTGGFFSKKLVESGLDPY